ncbi:MAG TPA: isocitrate lyase/phosphoenolpyruvate mutase family protein [Actinophytocola sp.]|jgi:2-methylisocitrate lyase-like PEP mutase family enzyme|uniref:isocitrate lyase/PEP mutase family protein n=1 Tax=Actinophytocola sp. TaxID=1872138 RepID=UPI002F95435F
MSFRDLHYGERPLVLPNAWDVGSALAFLEAGYPAIGTTSFGVGASAGHTDGSRSARAETRALVARLVALPCFITADVEDGYSDDPAEVADYVAGLGVAGVNLEDSTAGMLVDPRVHAAKVAAVKERDPDVFVNARVDTYWFGQDIPATLERALSYVDAGADGVFVPGAIGRDALRELTRAVPVPVNVLPVLPLDELAGLGARRVSTGSLPYRAAIDTAVAVAAAIRDGRPAPAATPYPDMQARLARFGS